MIKFVSYKFNHLFFIWQLLEKTVAISGSSAM